MLLNWSAWVWSKLQGFDSDFIFRNRLCILGRKTVAVGDNKSRFRQVKEWWFQWLLHLFSSVKELWRIFMLIIKYGTTKIELLYAARFSFLFHKMLKYYHQFINNLDCKSGCTCYLSKMQVKECLQALIQKQRAMPVVSHIKAVYCPTKICAISSERWKNSYMKTKKPHNRAVSVIYEHKKREIYVNFPWHDLCFVIECI